MSRDRRRHGGDPGDVSRHPLSLHMAHLQKLAPARVPVFVAHAAITLAALPLGAQSRHEIGSRRDCSACRIELQPLVAVGGANGPGALTGVSDVRVLPSGEIAVTHGGNAEAVTIFRAPGPFARTVGRAGRGPGEYRHAAYVTAVADRLVVTDPLERRATWLTASFEHSRVTPIHFEVFTPPVAFPDNRLVVNGLVRTPDRFGYLVHVVDADGTIVRSLAEQAGGVRADVSSETYFRFLAPTARGTVWAASRTEYRLEEWALNGTLIRSIRRNAEWFAPHAGGDNRLDPAVPKKPRLQGVQEDGGGRVWTIARVAGSQWARALRRVDGPPDPMRQPYEFTSIDAAYDTVIEVFDPVRGRLIASTRLDRALGQFAGPGIVASYENDADGFTTVRLWRLVLQER
jgi:hypothetical protein